MSSPQIITSLTQMREANENIEIFSGVFNLRRDNTEIRIEGNISFEWAMTPGVYFRGIILDASLQIFQSLFEFENFEILIDDLSFGTGVLLRKVTSFDDNSITVKGKILGQGLQGDKTVHASKIQFEILNLRELHGSTVEDISQGKWIGNNRLSFEDDVYLIHIDKSRNFKELVHSLKEKGDTLFYMQGN
jgi:hypothetical protein